MSITVVMVALVIEITGNVLNIWTHTTGTLATENQAALIFDLVAKDLRGAVMKRDGRVWIAATIQNDQTGAGDAGITVVSSTGVAGAPLESWAAGTGIIKPGQGSPGTTGSSLNIPTYTPPVSAAATLTTGNMVSLNSPTAPSPSSYRFGQAGVWLRLFTTQPDNALPVGAVSGTPNGQNDSVPRAVGYQIARIALTPTDYANNLFHYYLFRSTVRPWATAVDTPSGNVSNVLQSQGRSTFGAGYDFFYTFTAGLHTAITASYSTSSSGGTNLGDAGTIRTPNLQRLRATTSSISGCGFGVGLRLQPQPDARPVVSGFQHQHRICRVHGGRLHPDGWSRWCRVEAIKPPPANFTAAPAT